MLKEIGGSDVLAWGLRHGMIPLTTFELQRLSNHVLNDEQMASLRHDLHLAMERATFERARSLSLMRARVALPGAPDGSDPKVES